MRLLFPLISLLLFVLCRRSFCDSLFVSLSLWPPARQAPENSEQFCSKLYSTAGRPVMVDHLSTICTGCQRRLAWNPRWPYFLLVFFMAWPQSVCVSLCGPPSWQVSWLSQCPCMRLDTFNRLSFSSSGPSLWNSLLLSFRTAGCCVLSCLGLNLFRKYQLSLVFSDCWFPHHQTPISAFLYGSRINCACEWIIIINHPKIWRKSES